MYLLLREGVLKEIISEAVEKAGSFRLLVKKVNIPRSTLAHFKNRKNVTIRHETLERILFYIEKKLNDDIILKKLDNNWKQKIGGDKCFAKKKKDGTLYKQLEKSREKIPEGKRLIDWHNKMKKNNPEDYHKTQYEHFKKVGGYKLITNKGEKVRNQLEKDVADRLYEKSINYKYEPLIKAGKRYFFPDFLIKDKIIIECTTWRGYEKAFKLKEKIKLLRKKYRIYVFITPKVNKYYISINKYIIRDLPELIKLVDR